VDRTDTRPISPIRPIGPIGPIGLISPTIMDYQAIIDKYYPEEEDGDE
jgi:hypothetical protein